MKAIFTENLSHRRQCWFISNRSNAFDTDAAQDAVAAAAAPGAYPGGYGVVVSPDETTWTEAVNRTTGFGGVGESSSGGVVRWQVSFLFLVVIGGIVGNLLVCVSICLEKKLQNVTNYFLMSLAIADLFVSMIVMPCWIIQELMGKLASLVYGYC